MTDYEASTNKRETRAAGRHRDAAEQKFDEICEYVRTTKTLLEVGGAAPEGGVPKSGTRTLDALMELWIERTTGNAAEESYIDRRAGVGSRASRPPSKRPPGSRARPHRSPPPSGPGSTPSPQL